MASFDKDVRVISSRPSARIVRNRRETSSLSVRDSSGSVIRTNWDLSNVNVVAAEIYRVNVWMLLRECMNLQSFPALK